MKGFLLLLYCFAILGHQLCGANNETPDKPTTASNAVTPMTSSQTNSSSFRPLSSTSASTSTSISSKSMSTSTAAATATTATTATATTATMSSVYESLFKTECHAVTLVAGGLVLACAILLISTLMLLCKVCHLSRRLKMLNSTTDLISNSENCTVTVKKTTGSMEATETTVLMSDMGQTQEGLANGATKEEEGGQVKQEKQTADGNQKEVGGVASSEEAPTGESKNVVENPSASQPQEDTTNPQPNAAAASSSEGGERAKDVV